MSGRDSEERHALANALDKIGNALGAIASVMADHERRIAAIERKLSHKTREAE